MAKIKYVCKKCNWETSIREEWGDLKPKRCMNKKCNTSFIKTPDQLSIQIPEVPKVEVKEDLLPKNPKSVKAKKQDAVIDE